MKKIVIIFMVIIMIGIGAFFTINNVNINEKENDIKEVVNNIDGNEKTPVNNCNITTIPEIKEIKNEDGEILINVKYERLVIENEFPNEYIEMLNDEYESYLANFLDQIDKEKEEAQNSFEQMEDLFMPYTRELSYETNMNKNGFLSITTIRYYNSGGAHGSVIKESRNFDINKKEELSLSNVINDNVWNLKDNLYKLFKNKLEKDGLEYDEFWEEALEGELQNIQFYLKDGGIVLYFNTDQVAPYVFGEPTIEIPYNAETFLIKI